MTEPDGLIKQAIRGFLESCNLGVVELPTAPTKTPDLLVEENGRAAALIEIKQKSHDPDELNEFFQQSVGGNIASRSRATGYRNLLDGIIGSGVKQLKTKDTSNSLLHVLWLHCEGRDASLHDMRLRATLYGTQKLFSTGHAGLITCYYFWDSSFFKYRRSLDAAVLSKGTGAQLLLNEHSSKFEEMKCSGLARAFGPGVWFPAQYGITEDAMICDFVGPRKDEVETLKFLRSKYGFDHLQTMDIGLHEAMISLPAETEEF